jgi:transcriptional regulator with XRE-family HTH domain
MYLNPSFGKVGNRLKMIRKQYNWTLQEACDKVKEISNTLSKENENFQPVKLNPSHLSKIENDEIDTSNYYIALLCEVYQVKLSELYSNDDNFENHLSTNLLHLPPHLRDFVSNPDNMYLLNMSFNLKEFDNTEKDVIRKFLRNVSTL